jgi:hypothetical protein
MKTSYLLLFLCLSTNSIFGQAISRNQGVIPTTFKGALPEKTPKVNLVEGTPFFKDEWARSEIHTPDGLIIQNISTKIDLLENRIHYLDSSGKEAVVTTPLKEIFLEQEGKNTPIHFVDGHLLPNPRNGWYQLLYNDTLSLVKGFRKFYDERISYGSGPEHRLLTQEFYYVYLYYQEYDVKKPADFIRILPSRKAEIEKQIKKLDKKLSLEEQLIEMAAYCNTFPKLRRFNN